jgi:integrase
MAAMGRRRKNDDGLEPRVYFDHGAFYYVHKADGRWEHLGTDKEAANAKGRLYNDPDNLFGTLVYWLDMFLADCDERVKAGTLAKRTAEDYRDAIVVKPRPDGKPGKSGALRTYFAPPMTPRDLTPDMVQDFLDDSAAAGRGKRGNMDKAALSSAISWMIRKGKVPGLVINPCLRASGVKRNPGKPRDLYVETDWYREVHALAPASVRLMMELTYRTLQRPESDIILWTTKVLATERGRRVLKFRQNKTGKDLTVVLDSDLDAQVRAQLGTVVGLEQHLIHTRDGKPYGYDGLSAMLRRYIKKANARRKAEGRPLMLSWGFRDLKGKGATDMWQAGVPIEEIQHLCGHDDKATTEIYVKQRWSVAAEPNRVVMG